MYQSLQSSVFDGGEDIGIRHELQVSPVAKHFLARLFAVTKPVVTGLLTSPRYWFQCDVKLDDLMSTVTEGLMTRHAARAPHVNPALLALDPNRLSIIDNGCLIVLLILPVDL